MDRSAQGKAAGCSQRALGALTPNWGRPGAGSAERREQERESYQADRTRHGLAQVHNPEGSLRVVVTKDLPGTRWTDILTKVQACPSLYLTSLSFSLTLQSAK